jgi:hypothetical protein
MVSAMSDRPQPQSTLQQIYPVKATCNSVIRQKGRACESTTASNRRVAEIDDFGEGRARQRCKWAKQADYPIARRVA